MFLEVQDFDFAQILGTFAQILPKINLLGDTSVSPAPTALRTLNAFIRFLMKEFSKAFNDIALMT